MIVNRRTFIAQTIIVLTIVLLWIYFYINVTQHLIQDNIASGFGFLKQPAGFDLIMHLISFSPASTYFRAFLVGVLNTLLLSALAIVFATTIGLCVALARLSRNWLLAKLGTIYVEIFRNLPLLLQVFFWYFVLLHYLPTPPAKLQLLGFISINVRAISIFGITLIPELTAMLLALSLYSASYISENIRSGISSVDNGQKEAAFACGLTPYMTLRLIILPQAARVIIPPLISQYLNILKNSSLGSAIGYPDLVAVFAGTVLNQTGQAIETIFMTMSFYLILSILISYLMNLYNSKMALKSK